MVPTRGDEWSLSARAQAGDVIAALNFVGVETGEACQKSSHRLRVDRTPPQRANGAGRGPWGIRGGRSQGRSEEGGRNGEGDRQSGGRGVRHLVRSADGNGTLGRGGGLFLFRLSFGQSGGGGPLGESFGQPPGTCRSIPHPPHASFSNSTGRTHRPSGR